MLNYARSNGDRDDWVGSVLWKAHSETPNILIPLEVDHNNLITGYIVLDESGLPEDGQNTLFDYAGSSFRESQANLTIHRQLADPSLEDGYTITLLKLAHSIDSCNALSQNHAIKTAFWARSIASKLGYSQEKLDQIELASKLHDIGKVLIPKAVLVQPLRLSELDWKIMRRHPTFGALIMKPSTQLHPLIPFVEAHHENFDGSGYPSGLVGEQIPHQARIITIADAYSTMTEGRVYRSASTRMQALRELIRCCGRQFDPEIIAVMIDIITSEDIDDTPCEWEAF